MRLHFLCYPSTPSSSTVGAVVFLHGLGAGADDFADLPRLLSLSLNVRYIFPQAPNLPVTINGGLSMPAWYDIKDISFERNSDPVTVSHSMGLLSELLDRLVAEGIPAEKILIGGFSQGGAMALEVGMNYHHNLAGVISLSAYSLSPEKIKGGDYNSKKEIPLLVCHGKGDQVVPFELGNRHRKIFQKQGFDLSWYEEEVLGHNLSPGEIEAMKEWLKRFSFLEDG